MRINSFKPNTLTPEQIVDHIKDISRLPDQGLQIGDIVYSEYYKCVGSIARLSKHNPDYTQPCYVLARLDGNKEEFVFGVHEHNWHHSGEHTIKYNRLIKLNFTEWKDMRTYSTKTGELIK